MSKLQGNRSCQKLGLLSRNIYLIYYTIYMHIFGIIVGFVNLFLIENRDMCVLGYQDWGL